MSSILNKTVILFLLMIASEGFSQPGFPPPTIPVDGGIISFLLVGGLLGAGLIKWGRKK